MVVYARLLQQVLPLSCAVRMLPQCATASVFRVLKFCHYEFLAATYAKRYIVTMSGTALVDSSIALPASSDRSYVFQLCFECDSDGDR